jgi:nucleoside-diphosphate-sugar epimerase
MTNRREFLGLSACGLLGASAIGQASDQPPPRPFSILMLGGTGFLGPHTVEAALRRGHKVTLFNRGKTRPGLFPDLEKLHGDRQTDDLKALEGRQWDAVVDTSANVPRWVKKAAAILGPNIGHYLYISSVSVYAETSKPGMDESAAVATIADTTTEKITAESYGALKALSEKAAEEAMPGKVSVVRPGLIVGPDDPTDRFTYWPVRVARGGEVLAPGSPQDPVQLIDVRDLGAFLVKLIEDKATGVFNALGPDKLLTMGQMLAACKTAAQSNVQSSSRKRVFTPGATCPCGCRPRVKQPASPGSAMRAPSRQDSRSSRSPRLPRPRWTGSPPSPPRAAPSCAPALRRNAKPRSSPPGRPHRQAVTGRVGQ